MRLCSKCGCSKPVEEFYIRPNGNPHSWCKACMKQLRVDRNPEIAEYQRRRRANRTRGEKLREKDYQLQYKFGITLEEYAEKLETQRGCCAICGKEAGENLVGTHENKELAVDHDEVTGLVRGLLCDNCNNGIGRFRHSVGLLSAAKMYLELWRAQHGMQLEEDEQKQKELAHRLETFISHGDQ